MTTNPVFNMDHYFDAPVALVWRCFSTPDLIACWYGPGVETEVHGFAFQVGALGCMK